MRGPIIQRVRDRIPFAMNHVPELRKQATCSLTMEVDDRLWVPVHERISRVRSRVAGETDNRMDHED
jgi:hypothetical protein